MTDRIIQQLKDLRTFVAELPSFAAKTDQFKPRIELTAALEISNRIATLIDMATPSATPDDITGDLPGDEDDEPAIVTDARDHTPRSTDEPFAQPLRYGIDWDDIPQYPNYPACKLTCVDCDGEPHHWFSEYIDFAATNPDHPAAKAGHEVWQVCKHCPAWRLVPDEDEELRCQRQRCKGPPEVMIVLPMLGAFCRWHAIQAGRESLKSSGGEVPKFDIEIGAFQKDPDLIFKINDRVVATPEAKILHCPNCKSQHVDTGDWKEIPHRTHRCAHCKHEWRPFDHCTVGVSEPPKSVSFKFEVDNSLASKPVVIELAPTHLTEGDIAQPIVNAINRAGQCRSVSFGTRCVLLQGHSEMHRGPDGEETYPVWPRRRGE